MTTETLLSAPHPQVHEFGTAFAGEPAIRAGAILADIARRSIQRRSDDLSGALDARRVIERAIQIDGEESGSPLTESQWDFGLDMLARSDAPEQGTGVAERQKRIIAALSRALSEVAGEGDRFAS